MRKHCWTGALCVLLCCTCLAGCGLLDREYRVTKEHSDRYWESESADILRAESYDDVVSDLLILIGRHTESATLRLYQFPDDAAAAEALEQAALEVQQETALGTYAVEYITSELEPQRAYQEATIHLGYRRTEEQLQSIVSATSTAALPELLPENGAHRPHRLLGRGLSGAGAQGRSGHPGGIRHRGRHPLAPLLLSQRRGPRHPGVPLRRRRRHRGAGEHPPLPRRRNGGRRRMRAKIFQKIFRSFLTGRRSSARILLVPRA